MKTKSLLLWLLLLMGALSAQAQQIEAYFAVTYDEYDINYVSATFYYDNLRAQRKFTFPVTENGTQLFNENTFYYGNGEQDLNIYFDSSFANYHPRNTSYWFSYSKASTIVFGGWENLNTSEVTNMSHMFYGMSRKPLSLENLDLSHFDTRKVTDMSYMLSSMHLESMKNFRPFLVYLQQQCQHNGTDEEHPMRRTAFARLGQQPGI